MGDLGVVSLMASGADENGVSWKTTGVSISREDQDLASCLHGVGSPGCVQSKNHLSTVMDTCKVNANHSQRFSTRNDQHREDGFQELLELVQEYEYDEADKTTMNSEKSVNDKDFSTGGLQADPLATKEGGNSIKPEMNMRNYPTSKLPAVQTSTSCHSHVLLDSAVEKLASKKVLEGVAGSLHVKEVVNSTKKKALRNTEKRTSCGSLQANFTVPRPFSLATDKRASLGGKPVDEDCAHHNQASVERLLDENGVQQEHMFDHSYRFRKLAPSCPHLLNSNKFFVAKSIRSESIKHQEQALEKLSLLVEQIHDDDIVSVSSRQSSQAPKAKVNVSSSTTGFKFRSDARAEKRKEFYSMLHEKQKAKEDEKNQMQAKSKKETEEEIKLLRRSLTFKASPMPDFYQGGPPPKVELKKIPTTRAKSPKFSRRKSHPSESGSEAICKSVYCGGDNSSNGSLQEPANTECTKRSVRRSLSHLPIQKHTEPEFPLKSCSLGDASALSSINISAVATDHITVCESIESKENEAIIAWDATTIPVRHVPNGTNGFDDAKGIEAVVGTELTDNTARDLPNVIAWKEINEGFATHILIDEGATNNVQKGNGFSYLKGEGAKGGDILVELDRMNDKPKIHSSSKMLKGSTNIGSRVAGRTNEALKSKPLAIDNTEDLSAKALKSGKKERLKALTPYFRKCSSTGGTKQQSGSLDVSVVSTIATTISKAK